MSKTMDMTDRTANSKRRQLPRRAFTLVELLVVIMIATILASLSAAAYFTLAARAKYTSTEAFIAQLDSALRERMELFNDETRTSTPSEESRLVAGFVANSGSPSELRNNLLYRRAIVIERLQGMRESFPQQFADFMRRPTDPANATTGDHAMYEVTASTDKGRGIGRRAVSNSGRTAIFLEYLKRTKRSNDGSPQLRVADSGQFNPTTTYDTRPYNHDPNTESAECLYLILSTKVSGATFSIDNVPSQFVADTDGDGLNEFVDAWGKPLRYYRWPTDYVAYLQEVTKQLARAAAFNAAASTDDKFLASNLDPEATLTEPNWFNTVALRSNAFEKAGFYRLHPAYNPFTTSPSLTDPTLTESADGSGTLDNYGGTPKAYQLMPLIVSAGPDGKFAFRDPPASEKRAPFANEMHFRGARIDPSSPSDVGEFGDNISNILIVSGRRQ